ncbi:carboxymuconolactone decarboxylase family protein [Nocardia coubleae]|uniref:Carboxymuconolactone decarboxylase family protein n=1 Tax=Nocardia coubleae TaxID=356147 RepID=A0A846W7E7_9NOCA|nr:carboxymuconolactone decarboxylase family protein [Nocardia coubleae]NKX88616.1 carboxymuconolactone decarboxylase family protein [Nocardia coubleae]
MRVIGRIRGYATVVRRARRHRGDLVGWLGRRPQIGVATAGYETALLFSNKLDPRLKELAELKTAGLVACQFCLDIGSALAHTSGLSERQITDLPRYRTSDAYSELEKLVIAFAEAMTVTPAVDIDELRADLLTHLTKAQLIELAATIAWENQRARLNQGLGVQPTGMADGLACAMPERPHTP